MRQFLLRHASLLTFVAVLLLWEVACRTLGIPYVWSLRGTLDDWSMGERTLKKRAYLALGGRSGLEHAAFCHCTAQDEARQSHKWFPRGRARVIPNLLDLTPFAELPGPALAREKFAPLRSGRPSILFLSRLHYKKGIPLLIEAADLLRSRGVEAEVLIAGTGEDSYREELAGMIRRRGLQDRICAAIEKSPSSGASEWGFTSARSRASRGKPAMTCSGAMP